MKKFLNIALILAITVAGTTPTFAKTKKIQKQSQAQAVDETKLAKSSKDEPIQIVKPEKNTKVNKKTEIKKLNFKSKK